MKRKNDKVFGWLATLDPKNLLVLTKVEKSNKTFTKENWDQITALSRKPGDFAMVLILRQDRRKIIQTGLICHGHEWETVDPAFLALINQLKKKITFAEILEEYPDCPVKNTVYADQEDLKMDDIFEEVLGLTWPIHLNPETVNPIPERQIDPVDRMLEWLEALPASNLQATVQLGNEVMEFNKSNWFDLTGFGRCADDRFRGEIIISRTEPTGEQTIAGILLEGEWFVLTADCVKKDHGSKYPKNSKYMSFSDVFPDCPLSKDT